MVDLKSVLSDSDTSSSSNSSMIDCEYEADLNHVNKDGEVESSKENRNNTTNNET